MISCNSCLKKKKKPMDEDVMKNKLVIQYWFSICCLILSLIFCLAYFLLDLGAALSI